ncbi:ribosomal-protein-alanine N-acetyltransferase [compost metagenome]
MKIQTLNQDHHTAMFNVVKAVLQAQGLKAEFYWPEDMLGEELEQTEALGIFKGGELAGFVLYRLLPMAWEISLVATSPRFRRQGLMETLLAQLINAKGQGMELWLEVHENNVSAQNLYEKLGFRRTGVRTKYYKDGASAFLYSCP